MVYFNQKPYADKSTEEAEQRKQVLQFKENFPEEGLWQEYEGAEDFMGKVHKHLRNYIRAQYALPGQASEKVSGR